MAYIMLLMGAVLSVVMSLWMNGIIQKNTNQFERFAQQIFGVHSSQEGISSLEQWFNKIGIPTRL